MMAGMKVMLRLLAFARDMFLSFCVRRAAVHLGPGGGLASYSDGAAGTATSDVRHGEVKNQVAGASGVLQVVEDLDVTVCVSLFYVNDIGSTGSRGRTRGTVFLPILRRKGLQSQELPAARRGCPPRRRKATPPGGVEKGCAPPRKPTP